MMLLLRQSTFHEKLRKLIITQLSIRLNTCPRSIKISTLNTCHKRDTRKEQNTCLRYIRTSTSSLSLKKDMKREWSIKLLRDKWYTLKQIPKYYPFSILMECFNNHSPIPKQSKNNHIEELEDTLGLNHHKLTLTLVLFRCSQSSTHIR